MFGLVIKKKSTIKRLKAQSNDKSKVVKKLRSSHSAAVKKHSSQIKKLREEQRKLTLSFRTARQDNWKLIGNLQHATDNNLALALEQDASLPQAMRTVIDKLIARGRRTAARSLAIAFKDSPLTADMGNFALGVFMYREAFFATALAYLETLGQKTALEIAPVEYIGSLLDSDRTKGLRLLDKVYSSYTAPIRAELNVLRAKHLDSLQLRKGVDELLGSQEALAQLEPEQVQQLKWSQALLARPPVTRLSKDAVMIGVMDYKLLDRKRTSSNLGDYVQTLAMLANLTRFSQADFVDGSELGQFAADMQKRVDVGHRITGQVAKVQLVPVDRDYASGRQYPGPVWIVANGWYMHRNFRGEFDFPFNKNIKPIFVSFHLNHAGLLNQEIADYLKACGPIGCRDWTTVYRLRDYGVPAFFSGCLTTTVGTIFPTHSNPGGPTAIVDVKQAGDSTQPGPAEFTQIGDQVRDMDLVTGLRRSVELLETYSGYGKILTSRLHCYLPCRSIGMPVDFTPKNKADIRFEGLLDLPAPAFAAMRQSLSTKLSTVFEKILSGAKEADVRSVWRELCLDDVAAAEAHCTAREAWPVSKVDVVDTISKLKANALNVGPAPAAKPMEVAFAADANLAQELLTVIASLVNRNRSPIRVHLLLRGLGADFAQKLKADFPKTSFVIYFFDMVNYGSDLRMLSHTAVSTMDRLLLPDLLNAQQRVLYLDVDILVRSDLTSLYRIDLKGHAIAAKASTYEMWSTGVRLVTKASLSLPFAKAWQLRRHMHGMGSLVFPTFNAGVLVLDLERLRRDNFTAFALPLIEQYAFNDQDALNLYARGKFLGLETKWNYVPNQDWCSDPHVVHWAGPSKPWQADHVAYKAEFLDYRNRLS